MYKAAAGPTRRYSIFMHIVKVIHVWTLDKSIIEVLVLPNSSPVWKSFRCSPLDFVSVNFPVTPYLIVVFLINEPAIYIR